MQQTDVGDPGEYVINFSDTMSASPSSALRVTNLMERKSSVQFNVNPDLMNRRKTTANAAPTKGFDRSKSSNDLVALTSNLRL